MLGELLLGTPATDTEPASEGLLTAEMQKTITDFLGGIIDSMSQDSNYAEDGDTSIAVTFGVPVADNGGDNGTGGDNNTSGGDNAGGGDSEGCGSAISLGTGSVIAGAVLLAACAVIFLRKLAANK